MPSTLASLKIAIDSSDMKRASIELDKLTKQGRKTEQATNGLSRSVIALGASYLSLTAISSVTQGFLRQADTMILLDSQIKLVTNSTSELVQTQSDLFELSQETRQSLEATTNLYARMARAAESLGTSQEDLLIATKSVNQGLIISGASASEASSTITQLSQALASGVLRGEEFNSISENGSRIARALSDNLGVTIGQLRAMAKEGKLTSDVVMKALIEQAPTLGAEFDQMGTTVDQSMTTVSNSMLILTKQLNKTTGATDLLAGAFEGLSTWVDSVSSKLNKWEAQDRARAEFALIEQLRVAGDLFNDLANAADISKGGGFGENNFKRDEKAANEASKALDKLVEKYLKLFGTIKDVEKEGSGGGILATGFSNEDLNAINKVSLDIYLKYLDKKTKADEDYINQAVDNFMTGFSSTKTDAQFDKFLKERNKAFADSIKTQTTESEKMWENVGELAKNNIGNALQDGMDGTLDLTSFTSQLSKAAGQALLFSGGLGSVAGVGLMAVGALLSGGDDKSQAEIAQEEFDTFISGLDKASQALEDFGNVGSSIENQIVSLQKEITSTWIKEIGAAGVHADMTLINLLKEELSDIVASTLADTLDISALTTAQLEDLTSGIDIEAMEAFETELNNIALAMKTDTATAEDLAKATDILSDAEFAKFQDVSEALDILNDKEEERLAVLEDSAKLQADIAAQVNQEMLGSLSYLNDIEKLSFANNLYRTAITPEDRVTSSRQIAELSLGTTRTKEDFIPVFTNYIDELKAQGDEATTQDVVNALGDVVIAIEAQTDSATDDAKYA